jgi:hypothetical protein
MLGYSKSTKPHGVTSRDFILNKLKSPLHITCLGLIYLRARFIKLHLKFLKRYAVSFPLHKTHGDVPPSEPVWQLEFIAVVCSGVTKEEDLGTYDANIF